MNSIRPLGLWAGFDFPDRIEGEVLMASQTWKHGGVTLEFREDGSLQVYAPDANRVLGPDVAVDLLGFLTGHLQPDTRELSETEKEADEQASAARQALVPGGVIATSEGPIEPLRSGVVNITQQGADALPKRRPGRPRKAQS